ncbi:glycosyltransferase [Acidithrix sp. C25]|uniref:glycosyltransferase family 2 protein n=1 Tax=Acidithrix sp. C25 TaxID=1671482 RepID=UPI00191BA06E|nr:glycosyltransferase [Acidithrix sp. C25]CAG4931682.1 unnamed protein product [Acidithrix sp. C25]
MTINYFGLGAVVTVALAALGAGVLPLFSPSKFDLGNGKDLVIIPKSAKGDWRRPAMLMVTIIFATSFVLIDLHQVARLYKFATLAVVLIAFNSPSAHRIVSTGEIPIAIRVLIALDYPLIALFIRARLVRRLAIASNAIIYLILTISLDALEMIISSTTGLAVGPFSIEGTLLTLFLSTVIYLRFLHSTFVLPGVTSVKREGAKNCSDTIRVLSIVTGLLLILGIGLFSLASIFKMTLASLTVIGITAYPAFYTLSSLLIIAVTPKVRPGLPRNSSPPLEIITPAYNESASIASMIKAIDAGALTYGGPVSIIIADDGSMDDTRDQALSVASQCRWVKVRVLSLGHAGKAFALNSALAETSTEIVIRIDADTIIDSDAFLPLPGWFANPEIGLVGTLPSPRSDEGVTWFDHMRRLEEIKTFGFNLLAQSRVNSINCIPGTFVAFRRSAALRVSGFAFGMNGEDADFTMQISRLGFRAVVDTSIKIKEDVPSDIASFREQRVRWTRAVLHTWSRHSPFYAGLVGPRAWFFYPKMLSMRALSLARGVVPLWILASIFSRGTATTREGALIAFGISGGITLSVLMVLVIRYDNIRRLPWLPTVFLYSLLKRFIGIEALFTLPLIDDARWRLRNLTNETAYPPTANHVTEENWTKS